MRTAIKRMYRRLRPARQTAVCAGCAAVLVERRRRPCPTCGGLRRIVVVGWDEATVTRDLVG